MSDRERHVAFPPGLGQLAVATSSRQAALAGLAMYGPCRPWTVAAHRLVWLAVSKVGPAALPGRRAAWRPDMEDEVWHGLRQRWERELGRLDGFSVDRRRRVAGSGFSLLAMRDAKAHALIKVRAEEGTELANEHRALRCLRQFAPTSFSIPEPIAAGEYAGWQYLALASLTTRPHRPPRHPPLQLVLREIAAALAALPRPEGIPAHWCPMHGDFTPWNLRRLDDGRLVLFDWELAGWGPPGTDETLYRATEAALGRSTGGVPVPEEAIAYWQKRIGARLALGGRRALTTTQLSRALSDLRRNRPPPAPLPDPE